MAVGAAEATIAMVSSSFGSTSQSRQTPPPSFSTVRSATSRWS
jgi:hypothetical protein